MFSPSKAGVQDTEQYFSHINEDNVLDELQTNATLQEEMRQYLKNEYGIEANTPDEIKESLLSRFRRREANITHTLYSAATSPTDPHKRRLENLAQRVYDLTPMAWQEGGSGLGKATGDVIIGAATDPVNYIAGWLSIPKAVIGQAVTRAAGPAVKEAAVNIGERFLASGTKEAAEVAGRELSSIGAQGWGSEAGKSAIIESAKTAAKRGVAIEAPIGALAGYADQARRVGIETQDSIDPLAVGLGATLGGVLGGGIGGVAGGFAGRTAFREMSDDVARQTVGQVFNEMPNRLQGPGVAPSSEGMAGVRQAFEETVPGSGNRIDQTAASAAARNTQDSADDASTQTDLAEEARLREEEWKKSIPHLADDEVAKGYALVDSLEAIQLRMADGTPTATKLRTLLQGNDAASMIVSIQNMLTPEGAFARANAERKLAEFDDGMVELTPAQQAERDKTRTWLNGQNRMLNLVRSLDEEDLINDEEAFERVISKMRGFKTKEADASGETPSGSSGDPAGNAPTGDAPSGGAAPKQEAPPDLPELKPLTPEQLKQWNDSDNARRAAEQQAKASAASFPDSPELESKFTSNVDKLRDRQRLSVASVAKELSVTEEDAKRVLDKLVANGDFTPPVGRQKSYQKTKPKQEATSEPTTETGSKAADTPSESAPTADKATENAANSAEQMDESAQKALIEADKQAVLAAKAFASTLRASLAENSGGDNAFFSFLESDTLLLGSKDFIEKAAVQAGLTGKTMKQVSAQAATDTYIAIRDHMNSLMGGGIGYDRDIFAAVVDNLDTTDALKSQILKRFDADVANTLPGIIESFTGRFGRPPATYQEVLKFAGSYSKKAGKTAKEFMGGKGSMPGFEMTTARASGVDELINANPEAKAKADASVDKFAKSMDGLGFSDDARNRAINSYRNTIYNNYADGLKSDAEKFVDAHTANLVAKGGDAKALKTVGDKAKKALTTADEKVVDRLTSDPEVAKMVEIAKQVEFGKKVVVTRAKRVAKEAKDGSVQSHAEAQAKFNEALKHLGIIAQGKSIPKVAATEKAVNAPTGNIISVKVNNRNYEVVAGKDFVLKGDGSIEVAGNIVGSYTIKGNQVSFKLGEYEGVAASVNIEKIIAKRIQQNHKALGIEGFGRAVIQDAPDGTAIPAGLSEGIKDTIDAAELAASGVDKYRNLKPSDLPEGMIPAGHRVALMRVTPEGGKDIRVPKDGQTLGQVAGKTEGFMVGYVPEGARKIGEQRKGFRRIGSETTEESAANVAETVEQIAKRRALTKDEAESLMVELGNGEMVSVYDIESGYLRALDVGGTWDGSSFIKGKMDSLYFNEYINVEELLAEVAPYGIVKPASDRLVAMNQVAEIYSKASPETVLGMRNILARLAGDKAPIVRSGNGGPQQSIGRFNSEENALELKANDAGDLPLSSPDLAVFSHELGHWAWRNILSPDDRISVIRWIQSNVVDKNGNIRPEARQDLSLNLASGDADAVGNQFSNPNEIWANMFMAYTMSPSNAPIPITGIQSVMQKIMTKTRTFYEKFASKIGKRFGTSDINEAIDTATRYYTENSSMHVPKELEHVFNNILMNTSYEKRFGNIVDASGKTVDAPNAAMSMAKLGELDDVRYKLESVAIHNAWRSDPTEVAEAIKAAKTELYLTLFSNSKFKAIRTEMNRLLGSDEMRRMGLLMDDSYADGLMNRIKDYLVRTVDADDEATQGVINSQAVDAYESVEQMIDALLNAKPEQRKGILKIILDSEIGDSADPMQANTVRREIERLANEEGVSPQVMAERIIDMDEEDAVAKYGNEAVDSAYSQSNAENDELLMGLNSIAVELNENIRVMQDILADKIIQPMLPEGAGIQRFDSINRMRVPGEGSLARKGYKNRRAERLAQLELLKTENLISTYRTFGPARQDDIVQVLRNRSMQRDVNASLPAGKTIDEMPAKLQAAIEAGDHKSISLALRKALADGDADGVSFANVAYVMIQGKSKPIETVTTPAAREAAERVANGQTTAPISSLVERVTHRNKLATEAGRGIATRLIALLNPAGEDTITNAQMARLLGREVPNDLDPNQQVLEGGSLTGEFINVMRALGASLGTGKGKANPVETLAALAARSVLDGQDLKLFADAGDRNALIFAKHFKEMLADQSNPQAGKLKPAIDYFPEMKDLDPESLSDIIEKVTHSVAILTESNAFADKVKQSLGRLNGIASGTENPRTLLDGYLIRSANKSEGIPSLLNALSNKIKDGIARFTGKKVDTDSIRFVRLTRAVPEHAADIPSAASDSGRYGEMVYLRDYGDTTEMFNEIAQSADNEGLIDAAIRNHLEIMTAQDKGDEARLKFLFNERDNIAQQAGLKVEDYEQAPIVLSAEASDPAKYFDISARNTNADYFADNKILHSAVKRANNNADIYRILSRFLEGNGKDGETELNKLLAQRGFLGISEGDRIVGIFNQKHVRSVFDERFKDGPKKGTQPSMGFDMITTTTVPSNVDIQPSKDFAGWAARLELMGASDEDVSWFRKIFKRRDVDAKDIGTRVQWGKYFNLKTVAESIRKSGNNWIADFAQPSEGAGYFERQSTEFGSIIGRVFDSLDTLPDAQSGMKKWSNNIKFWGEIPQTNSEKRIVAALRRGDPRRLTEDELRSYNVVSREFRAELVRMKEAGIPVGDITTYTGVKGYFPQVWDTELLRKNYDQAVTAFQKYFMAENGRQIAEFGTQLVQRLPEEESLVKARKLVLKLTEDRGGLVSPDGRGTYRDVMADQFFHRKIVPTTDDLNRIGLEDFLVDNLRAISATYFDSSTRRRHFHAKFGERSHGLYDYLEVAQGGKSAIINLLMNKRERVVKFMSPGGADEEMRTLTIHPITKNPDEASQIAEQISSSVMKGDAFSRDAAKKQLMSLYKGDASNFERRADAIVNALYDHGSAGDALTGQDMDYVMGAFRTWQRKPMDSTTHSDAARIVSKHVRNVNAVTRLGFATLTSFTDIIYPAIRSGQLGSSIKAWRQYMGQEESYRKAAKNIGVGVESLLHEYLSELHGVESSRFTNAFFNANLMTPWTRMNREIASLTAYEAFKSEQAVAQKYRSTGNLGNKRYQTAVRFLRRYGLAEYAQEGARTLESIVDDQANDKIRAAVMKFSNEAIFMPNQNDIPLWAQTPWGAMVFQFKSFPLMMSRLAGYTLDEAKLGNYKPLLYLATIAPAFGASAQAIKDFAQMRGANDETNPTMMESMSIRDRSLSKQTEVGSSIVQSVAKMIGVPDNMLGDSAFVDKSVGWWLEGMLSAGGFGLVADMAWQSAESIDNGSFGEQRIASVLLGPTYGLGQDAIKIASGIAEGSKNVARDLLDMEVPESNYRQRQAGRSATGLVPIVGGNRFAREWGAELTGGEPSQ